ncbi:hypothetical protein OJ998_17265 [Solirubrobacter taibaiensis]|nr:hypothetical protein [Solirubrobacter taibaiensis]
MRVTSRRAMDSGTFQDDRGRSYEFKRNDLVRRRNRGGKQPVQFRWKRPSAVLVDERSVEIDSQWFKPATDQASVVAQVAGTVPYGITAGSTLTWYGEPKPMAVVRDPHGRVVGALVAVHDPAATTSAVAVTAYTDMTRQAWVILISVVLVIATLVTLGVVWDLSR